MKNIGNPKGLQALLIIMNGAMLKKFVCGGYRCRARPVTPFIGVVLRNDGTRERVIGAKCSNQEKMIFLEVNSNDPLCYLRALQMIEGVYEIDDTILKDCTVVVNNQACFLKTTTRGNNWVRHFDEVLQKVIALPFDEKVLEKIANGFADYGAPLVTAAVTPIAQAHTPILGPSKEPEVDFCPISPAKAGHFYDRLMHAQGQAATA